MKKTHLQKVGIAALACSIIVGTVGIPDAMAKRRGNSGLPDGPGNPIAAVNSGLQDLKQAVEDLAKKIADLEKAVADLAPKENLLWINYLDLVPGDTDVVTSYNSTNSGVGGGLSGLIITSTTAGENSVTGGNKVVEKGLQVPPGYKVAGVRVCFESSNPTGSFISQIRVDQLQETPDTRVILLDDGTDLMNVGPVCVDSASPAGGPIDPSLGSLLLSLRVNFADPVTNPNDKIVVRAIGLYLVP